MSSGHFRQFPLLWRRRRFKLYLQRTYEAPIKAKQLPMLTFLYFFIGNKHEHMIHGFLLTGFIAYPICNASLTMSLQHSFAPTWSELEQIIMNARCQDNEKILLVTKCTESDECFSSGKVMKIYSWRVLTALSHEVWDNRLAPIMFYIRLHLSESGYEFIGSLEFLAIEMQCYT